MTVMTCPPPPVQLKDATKTYGGTKAVDGVSLRLQSGECVILAGHNGAGKSTLIKLILGLLQPDTGEVRVLGDPTDSRAAAHNRRHIGYLPETVALHPSLTGRETLDFYARLKGVPTHDNQALLARLGIAGAARQRVGGYSKGMRQRLALAQALLGRPRILLLDEPTTGLDPASRLLFHQIVREMRDAGCAILLSTHALAELEGQADRIIVMSKGRKVADGDLAGLRLAAALPVRIRLALATDVHQVPEGWRRIGAHRIELSCAPSDKLKRLRQAHDIAQVCDIELEQPGLDEMYACFLEREDS